MMIFPQYRKYSNNKSYFEIIDFNTVIETKFLGKFYQVYEVKATTLPDRNFIADLLDVQNIGIELLDKTIFEKELRQRLAGKNLLA